MLLCSDGVVHSEHVFILYSRFDFLDHRKKTGIQKNGFPGFQKSGFPGFHNIHTAAGGWGADGRTDGGFMVQMVQAMHFSMALISRY